jgi:hypothetical protein
MCFGGGGPSPQEQQQAAQQRAEAEIAKQEQIVKRAEQKREDVSQALEARTIRGNRRGGAGRRSLFTSSGGAAGYLSRFL